MKTDEAHDAVLEIVQMLLRQDPGLYKAELEKLTRDLKKANKIGVVKEIQSIASDAGITVDPG